MPDITYTSVGSRQKRLVDIGDNTFAEVTSLPIALPVPWTPASVFNAAVFGDVEIQLIGTPTTPYIFQDSFDGSNFNDCMLLDRQGSMLASINAAGRFRLPGNCFLKARQGAGATFFIRAGS